MNLKIKAMSNNSAKTFIRHKQITNPAGSDGFEYIMAPCRFFLRLLGAWPDPLENDSWSSTLRILIVTTIMFLFAIVSQTVKLFNCWDNLNAVAEILSNCNIPTSIATVKIVNIWYHRHVLKDMLSQVIDDWKLPRTEEELTLMWQNAKSQLNSSVEWPLYMTGSFPYDTQKTPYYEFTIFGQLFSNVLASTSFSSSDSIFFILMLHLINQLSILKLSVTNLPQKIVTIQDRINFMNKFTSFHARHNQLWRFSLAVENTFNRMFLIQMVPCIFGLGTQGYQLISNIIQEHTPLVELVFMIYFLVLFLFTIFTYCYVAELLRRQSLEISDAIFACNWRILKSREIKLLAFVMARAQKPFEITVGKFANFSLQLYVRILKTSAGYLSMLLAVKEKIDT
ncbi:odorant receptor 10a-like isoform X2 [Trichogramma pretiosum]|uniref:odorant receptor 10a-like isoform X2 n=1 Tax=Trichogramma pretiosum TaxID=7493 RepID=UPI000C718F6E|nr:odorant receptor 10a-like isoform X2 [Trichogramma pretiosum]